MLETNIEIASVFGEEKKAMAKLEQMLLLSGCGENDRMDVKTALAEACLNAIEHGNGLNSEHKVFINIQVMDDVVSIKVCDRGKGAKLDPLPLNSRVTAEDFRGWGLFFIDNLVDEWDYFHEPGNNGFCVQMKKYFLRGW